MYLGRLCIFPIINRTLLRMTELYDDTVLPTATDESGTDYAAVV